MSDDPETFRAEEYKRRQIDIGGWPMNVTSYRLVDRWLCKIDNVSPGAVVSRGEGSSRQEAEDEALSRAAKRLDLTRKLLDARRALDEALALVDGRGDGS